MNASDDLTQAGDEPLQQGPSLSDETPPEDAASISGPSWQEQDEMLRAMWMRKCAPQEIADALGRSIPALMTRAARLGLPRRSAPGRKPGPQKNAESQETIRTPTQRQRTQVSSAPQDQLNELPKYSERICLMCLNRFQSAGRHNRICPTCKNSSEYASASALPDIQHSTF